MKSSTSETVRLKQSGFTLGEFSVQRYEANGGPEVNLPTLALSWFVPCGADVS